MGSSILIGISGKKQSGKSTLCDFIRGWHWFEFARRNEGYCVLQDVDGSLRVIKSETETELEDIDIATEVQFANLVAIYNFADTLKETCMKVMGLTWEQCYGTDKQKNTPTMYRWDTLPDSIREAYSQEMVEVVTGTTVELGKQVQTYDVLKKPRVGPMTGREVMQVVGTDIFRKMFSDQIWVNATFSKIKNEGKSIALIADVRFPSEVDAILDNGGYVIRLNRIHDEKDQHPSETALDDYPFSMLGNRALVINNGDCNINEKNRIAAEWIERILLS